METKWNSYFKYFKCFCYFSNTANIQANTNSLSNLTISDCTDVNAPAPTLDDVLTWDGTKWKADPSVNIDITKNTTDIASHLLITQSNTNALNNLVINDCGDVDTTTTSPVLNDVLFWNGTTWTSNSSIKSDIISNTTNIQNNINKLNNLVIDDCGDVDTTTNAPGNTDLLMYDSSSGKWKPDSTLILNVANNTNDILSNTNAIDELRVKTGAQLVYEVANITVGTGAVTAGDMFINNSDPTLVTGISLSPTDKSGTPVSQPYPGDSILLKKADNSSEHRYIISGGANSTAMVVSHVFSTPATLYLGKNILYLYFQQILHQLLKHMLIHKIVFYNQILIQIL